MYIFCLTKLSLFSHGIGQCIIEYPTQKIHANGNADQVYVLITYRATNCRLINALWYRCIGHQYCGVNGQYPTISFVSDSAEVAYKDNQR